MLASCTKPVDSPEEKTQIHKNGLDLLKGFEFISGFAAYIESDNRDGFVTRRARG